MQSVGEVMAIGRTFPESLQKALRSLEQGRLGLNADPGRGGARRLADDELLAARRHAPPPSGSSSWRPLLRRGVPVDAVCAEATGIDPWFLDQIADDHRRPRPRPRRHAGGSPADDLDRRAWRRVKRLGFSDDQLAYLWARRRGRPCRGRPRWPPGARHLQDRRHLRRRVRGRTPRTTTRPTRTRTRCRPPTAPRVVILGSGPNRIGQGIEFDYCCVHASLRPARRRLRDGHGQLQPRDRLHRLRHLGPPLLRAAHPRGRGAT